MDGLNGYEVLGRGAHALNTGQVRLGSVDAVPSQGRWLYLAGHNRFFAAGFIRGEIIDALATAGPDREIYRLSPQHAIVLYPEYITLDDLREMQTEPVGFNATYHLTAELPFGHLRRRVRLSIEWDQTEPLAADHRLLRGL